jgi:hypothetical protein
MTTSNAIEIASIPNVLSIPLEAVTADSGYSYVYKKDGRRTVRQMIETGAMNDNEIVVRQGLHEGDQVLVSLPAEKAGIETIAIPGLKPMVPGQHLGRHGQGHHTSGEAERRTGRQSRGGRSSRSEGHAGTSTINSASTGGKSQGLTHGNHGSRTGHAATVACPGAPRARHVQRPHGR